MFYRKVNIYDDDCFLPDSIKFSKAVISCLLFDYRWWHRIIKSVIIVLHNFINIHIFMENLSYLILTFIFIHPNLYPRTYHYIINYIAGIIISLLLVQVPICLRLNNSLHHFIHIVVPIIDSLLFRESWLAVNCKLCLFRHL